MGKSEEVYQTDRQLDEARQQLETLAAGHGLHLDFLMRQWNGRFATYNLGLPTEEVVDKRGGGRRYRLLARLKANTQPTGRVVWVLSPPTACDEGATAEDEARFAAFRSDLREALALRKADEQ